ATAAAWRRDGRKRHFYPPPPQRRGGRRPRPRRLARRPSGVALAPACLADAGVFCGTRATSLAHRPGLWFGVGTLAASLSANGSPPPRALRGATEEPAVQQAPLGAGARCRRLFRELLQLVLGDEPPAPADGQLGPRDL